MSDAGREGGARDGLASGCEHSLPIDRVEGDDPHSGDVPAGSCERLALALGQVVVKVNGDVPPEAAADGAALVVEINGALRPACVQAAALHDPSGRRMRVRMPRVDGDA